MNQIKQNGEERVIILPDKLNTAAAPHIGTPDTVRSLRLDVIVALIPAAVWGIYVFGMRALTVMAVSVLCALLSELVYCLAVRSPLNISDLSSAVIGLIIGMCMPGGVPLIIPALGSIFAVAVLKCIAARFSLDILNPTAAVCMLIALISGSASYYTLPFTDPSALSFTVTDPSIIADVTPLAQLKNGGIPDASIIDLLLGNASGAVGTVPSLLLCVGGIYLIARRVIKWQIPVVFIAVVGVAAFLYPHSSNSVDFTLASMLSGGVIFTAFFIASDYSCAPVTDTGRLIFGAGCGLITVLLRFFMPDVPGDVFIAVFVMNLLTRVIDYFTIPVRFGGVTRNGK